MLLGVDVGGTFTDAVLALGDGRFVTAKSPTTPHDQSDGVLAAIEAVLDRAGRKASEVAFFAHGMTVATNALLEGRAARTALAATEGFTDLIELARQDRPELYRLCARRPAPLAGRELRVAVPERMGPEGVLRPLTPNDALAVADRLAELEPEAIAVVLLHSYRHPQHELALRAALQERLPGVHVSLSHEVVGTFREYERAATTELDAGLSPLLGAYLRRLRGRAEDAGLPEPSIMQSSGGLIDCEAAAAHAALTVLSGPAGGAAGAAYAARRAGVDRALCFDMGGTSCDVCVIDGGEVTERGSGRVAGRPIALPMLDVHTVGAGGGSIAWADPGGALRVGPQSAGAVPGPGCYGRGGTEPTVTDANLLLGHLPGDAELAGGVVLDASLAAAAIKPLAAELGLDPRAAAEGILRVANAQMVGALRVVTVERGVDPRAYTLLAFGGAGPLHAAAIADELGIGTVLCPRESGVLAALGLIAAPRRRDLQRTVMLVGEALSQDAIAAVTGELGAAAREALGEPDAKLRAVYELRYRGQSFELAVTPDELAPAPQALRELFEREHGDRYGYTDPDAQLELVTVRVSATDTVVRNVLAQDENRHSAPATRPGPATIDLGESTVLVPEGWAATEDADKAIWLERA